MININTLPSFEKEMGNLKINKSIKDAKDDNQKTTDLCYVVTHEDHGETYVSPGHYVNSDETYEWILTK